MPALALALSALTLAAPPAAAGHQGVSILGYNVEYDSTAPGKTLAAIDAADADVVCMTEVTSAFAAAFEKRLGRKYPHRFVRARKSGTWGVAMASRFPLSKAAAFAQAPHRMPAVEARVAAGAGEVLVACLHFFPPIAKQHAKEGYLAAMKENAELREQQAENVVLRYAEVEGPVVLSGDMNEDAGGDAMKALGKGGFTLACAIPAQECGPTYPGATSILPAVFQVDHILGRGVAFSEARVVKDGGSDHFPVFARFVAAAPAGGRR